MREVKCNSSYHFSAEILHGVDFTIFLMALNIFFCQIILQYSSCRSIQNIVIFGQSLYFHIFYCINLVYPAVTDSNSSPVWCVWCRTCTAGSRSYFCSSVRTSLQTRHSASPPTERLEIECTSTTPLRNWAQNPSNLHTWAGSWKHRYNNIVIRYCALFI